MKKLLAALALAIMSATAVAGGGWNGNHGSGWNNGGWNSGWNNGGWNRGWQGGGGCFNCWNRGWGWNNGWAVAGGVVVGAAIGAAIAQPGQWVPQPVFVQPQPQVIIQQPQPVFIQQQAPQVVIEQPRRSELQFRLDELRAMYDRKELSYPEYYRLRAEMLTNFTMPR